MIKNKSPWLFFYLTFLFTWIFWGLNIIFQSKINSSISIILIALGGIGPMISAILLLFKVNNREYRYEFLNRLINIKRIPTRWGIVIFLFSPLLSLLAFIISKYIFNLPLIINTSGEFLNRNFIGFIWLLVFTLFFGPVPEEIGWRGYAQDKLQGSYSILKTSIIIGSMWSLWHLPLCFTEGTFQHSLGLGSLVFWRYFLDKIPEAIIMSWIYNNTNKSILSAILFHFITNLNPVEAIFSTHKEGAAFLPAEETLWVLFILRIITTLIIIIITDSKTFKIEKRGAK